VWWADARSFITQQAARIGTPRSGIGSPLDLSALTSFNSVATHGGFGQASRATGQPKATLSRHVRELEESLGARLIERSQQAFRLTEEGLALHVRTDGLLDDIKEAGQAVGGGLTHPRGRLRVSTTVAFAHMTMGRIAASFAARYPEVQMEVVGEDRYVNLVADGYDAVIRINPLPEHDLVGHCFLRDQMLVVVPASLAHLTPKDDAELTALPAIVLTNTPAAPVWTAHQKEDVLTIHPNPVLRLSSLLMVRDAVRAGTGAALLPHSMVADDLAAGRLVSWGAASERPVELWVLHTSRRLASPKVTAFVQFMRAAYAVGAVLDSEFYSPRHG